MELKPGRCREVKWCDVKIQVKKVAVDLFDAIEEMQLDNSYKLYEMEYPFGASVIDEDGKFNLPMDNGSLVPFTSDKIDNNLKDELGYHYPGIPMGLVLDGQFQLYMEEQGKVDSNVLFSRGDIIALNSALDLPEVYQFAAIWRMSAGNRLSYAMASLANKKKFDNLKGLYNLGLSTPSSQQYHWELFKGLANSQLFPQNWTAKILFFSKQWILDKSKKNRYFRTVLLERMRKTSAMFRSYWQIDKSWRNFSMIAKQRNKKVDAYILNMTRYILEASLGKELSYKIADKLEQAGPFIEIGRIISEHYGLEKYSPIIMHSNNYNSTVNRYGYTSIQLNPLAMTRSSNSHIHFLLSDFREIIDTINRYVEYGSQDMFKEVTAYDVKKYRYEFFSFSKDRLGTTENVDAVFKGDPDLAQWLELGYNDIYGQGSFLKASVRFSRD